MPPQVHKTGFGSGTVSNQAPLEEPKLGNAEKKSDEPQKNTSENVTAQPYRATPKEASKKKGELSAASVLQQKSLMEQLLTNISKTRAEMSRQFALAARGDAPMPAEVKAGNEAMGDTTLKATKTENENKPTKSKQRKTTEELLRDLRG